MNRRDVSTWISGPREALESQGYELGYRGERLGLPEAGVGSVASYGRRVGALFIDWIASAIVAQLIFPQYPYGSQSSALATLGVFFVVKTVFTILGGASFAQRLLGIRVSSLRSPYVDPLRATLRTFLICLVIPAAIWDRDGRGLHDRAARTVVLKARP